MKKHYLFNLAVITCLIAGGSTSAQSTTMDLPRVSQAASVSQRIGITDISIDYHRPAANGRQVWGQLIPYDKGNPIPWRGGANETTVFTNSTDIKIGGKDLPAGKYGIHFITDGKEMEMIFNSNHHSWGSYSYNSALDVIRVKTNTVSITEPLEFLTYQFTAMTDEKANLELVWGDRKAVFEISANTAELTFASIQNQLQLNAGWTWLGFHEAANYTYQKGVHMDQGVLWARRSVFTNPNNRNMLLLAQLTAKVNKAENEQEAIMASLEQSLANNAVTWKEYSAVASYSLNNNVNLEKGLEFAEKSIAMNPTMGNQLNKALILKELGRVEESEKFKKTAMEMASNAALNNYAYTLLYGGKLKESLEFFEFNAKQNPKDPNVFDSLGEAYFRNGMNKEAEKAFKTSLGLNPPANVRANTLNFLNQMGVDVEKL